MGGQLQRHGPGQADDAAFGHRVVELAEISQVGPAGDVHDGTAFGEVACQRARKPEGRPKVHVEDRREVFVGQIDQPGVSGYPGVVHQAE